MKSEKSILLILKIDRAVLKFQTYPVHEKQLHFSRKSRWTPAITYDIFGHAARNAGKLSRIKGKSALEKREENSDPVQPSGYGEFNHMKEMKLFTNAHTYMEGALSYSKLQAWFWRAEMNGKWKYISWNFERWILFYVSFYRYKWYYHHIFAR